MQSYLPILILVAAVAIVLARLPKVELGHSAAFLRRRTLNWLPLGLTYALLYMGRYNLTVSKNALGDLMTKADFGLIFGVGTAVYAVSFLVNGPLADRYGGRRTMLWAAAGAATMNVLMGLVTHAVLAQHVLGTRHLLPLFTLLYAVNMYFQSFGAVSIVKVNAPWFHVRERGTFGGVFGMLISLGIFLAFDVGEAIVSVAPTWWVFWVPAALLAVFGMIDAWVVRDLPSQAGHPDFDTGDASSGDAGPQLGPLHVAAMMLRNPVIVVIAAIEFCSGFLRNGIMHWYFIFAKQTGAMDGFVASNWGTLLCVAGILGGVFAGTVSDRLFDSRRGPVSAVLYAGMVGGSLVASLALGTQALGWVVVFMSLCVIGVHGMLSGTASMDFGGRKNVGVTVGIIDGCVYLGTAVQSLLFGAVLPTGVAAQDPANWAAWPAAMLVVAIVGLLLAVRVWHAKPQARGAAISAHAVHAVHAVHADARAVGVFEETAIVPRVALGAAGARARLADRRVARHAGRLFRQPRRG